MRRDQEFSWHPGGDRDVPARTFTVSAETADYLRSLWEQLDRTPPGERRTALIRDLTVTMDLLAYFDGDFTDEQEPSGGEAPIPSYLASQPLSADESARTASEPPEAPEGLRSALSSSTVHAGVSG